MAAAVRPARMSFSPHRSTNDPKTRLRTNVRHLSRHSEAEMPGTPSFLSSHGGDPSESTRTLRNGATVAPLPNMLEEPTPAIQYAGSSPAPAARSLAVTVEHAPVDASNATMASRDFIRV